MNTPQPSTRRSRNFSMNPELLETRQLLTGGAGNTFAIMQATVVSPNQRVSVPFTIDSSVIKTPRNQITLGVDVAKATGSTAMPRIVAIQDLTTKRMIPVTRANYTPSVAKSNPSQGRQTTAVQATIRINPNETSPHKYAAIISTTNRTTGGILVGFYLPGDTAGGGVVSTSDQATVKGLIGSVARSTNYSFPADANRDGIINAVDTRITNQNFGVVVSVSPVVSANLSPATDTAFPNRTTAFRTVVFTGEATPGASIAYVEANNNTTPVSTVATSKGQYSINVPLGDGSNTFKVTSVDAFGQTITGSIAPVVYDAKVTASLDANGLPIASTDKPVIPTA